MKAEALNIIKLQFVAPFESSQRVTINKKRTLREHAGLAGCYLIKENGKVVYIGMSKSCVVEALYRHFYEWNDRRGNHVRVTYYNKMRRHKYEVVIIGTCPEDAPKLEKSLIISFYPRDNKEKFAAAAETVTKSTPAWEPVDVEF